MQLLMLEFCQLISMQNTTGLNRQKVLGPLLHISEDAQLPCSRTKYKNLGGPAGQPGRLSSHPTEHKCCQNNRTNERALWCSKHSRPLLSALCGSSWWKESRDRVQNLFRPQAQNAKTHFGPISGLQRAANLAFTRSLSSGSAPWL